MRAALLGGLILLRASIPGNVDPVNIAAHLVAVAQLAGCADHTINLSRADTLDEKNQVERTVIIVSCSTTQETIETKR